MKSLFSILASLLLTAIIFLPKPISAQAPEKMSYQAVIRDGEGELMINSNIGMRISILQGSVDGAAVYVESQTSNTNENGLISIEIGNGTVASGAFSTIDWSVGLYFLKSETDLTGGSNYTIIGTSQLLSVPYAMHAKTVENVNDEDADPSNEIQDLQLNGTTLSITNNTNATNVDLSILQDGVDDAEADPSN